MANSQLPDRFWLTRHYVCASTLTSFAIAAFSPGSLNALAIDAAGGGLQGWLWVGILALVSLAALLETAVSHFVPGRQIPWLRRRRHTLFMSIAIGQVCVAYVVVLYAPLSAALALRFGLDAFAAALVAFLDLFSRHKADRCSL